MTASRRWARSCRLAVVCWSLLLPTLEFARSRDCAVCAELRDCRGLQVRRWSSLGNRAIREATFSSLPACCRSWTVLAVCKRDRSCAFLCTACRCRLRREVSSSLRLRRQSTALPVDRDRLRRVCNPCLSDVAQSRREWRWTLRVWEFR